MEEYCAGRPNVSFVHVDPWPGYKSGALNLALRQFTDPDAEIVGVIDADYLVDPSGSRRRSVTSLTRQLAFVQTPQDYRAYEGSTYLTACYDAYRYFFATAMPSRNERNSIIFAGTMGLLRKRCCSPSMAGMSGASPRTPTPRCACLRRGTPGCSWGRASGAASCR